MSTRSVKSSLQRLVAVVVLAGSAVLVVPVASAGAVAPALTHDQAFVTAAYNDFLGRYPTAAELTSATAVSLATPAARADVVSGLSKSPEWVRVTVNKLYVDTLGRTGDPGGVAYWVGMISSSQMSVAQVAAAFYSSPEYFAGFGKSNVRTWVLDLYTKILLRDGTQDPTGVNYWVTTTGSAGRGTVAYAFYQSNESRHTRVKGLYETLLGRAPDQAGWDYWAGLIATQGDLALAAELTESSEYYSDAFVRYSFVPVGFGALAAPRAVKADSYRYVVPTVGGTAPLRFSASGLPDGLAIDPGTGSISGTPTAVGLYQTIVTVTDANSSTATAHVQFVVDTISESATWLATVNAYRAASGVPLVTENAAWTAGIQKHLDYLANTPQSFYVGDYQSAHTENPASQWYTAAGAAAAASSDLAGGSGSALSDREAIEVWMTMPFHAIGLLRQNLTQSAFASKSYPSLGLWRAGVDVIRGLVDYGPPTRPILFPGPNSTMQFGSPLGPESPSPSQSCATANPAGLPLIAMLPVAPPIGTTATLKTPTGTTLTEGSDLCVVTAKTYVTTDPVYGPNGLAVLQGDQAVFVIPTKPLASGHYTATIELPGSSPVQWSFWIIPSA